MRKLIKQYSSLSTYTATKEELARLLGLLILMVFTFLVILIIAL